MPISTSCSFAMRVPDPARLLPGLWYGSSPVAWLLLPLAALFGLGVAWRRLAFRAGWLAVRRVPVPVIVVGNITVGGTGKTPVVEWLAKLCLDAGYRPGIVSRGYGGQQQPAPRLVKAGDQPEDVGDEPLLLHRRTGLPVSVCPDRVAAARQLVAAGVNVVIADDGLQHYQLARDLEIAIVDGDRRLGNGWLLPAGPLREPASRLREVDLVLIRDGTPEERERSFSIAISGLRELNGEVRTPLAALHGKRVRVIAGIGNPGRFHQQLAAAGLDIVPVPVSDHGAISPAMLCAGDGLPVVMTEKDAVKYPGPYPCPVWVAELRLTMPPEAGTFVLARLGELAPMMERQ